MEQVFELKELSNEYEVLVLKDSTKWQDLKDMFDGTPLKQRWKPIEVEVLRDDKRKDRLKGDCPSLSPGVAVFSERAVAALKDMLEASGELLPLLCDDGQYYLFNVTSVIDALDESSSDLLRFSESGRVMRVKKYVFHSSVVSKASVFKIPQLVRSHIFVVRAFAERARERGLAGFDFRLLWQDQKR